MTELQTKLMKVQSELKAPKGQFNAFGKYKYRSCEDVLEAVKPLCIKEGLLLTVSDSLECIGDRHYVKAVVRLAFGEESIEVCSYAREAETKKGMDESQITGAASSYARKYALNGMFCIDDTKDADTQKPTEDSTPHYTTKKQQADLYALVQETKSDEKKFLEYAGVTKYTEILAKDYPKLMKALEAKMPKKKPTPKKDEVTK